MSYQTVNLEQGMPTVEFARTQLNQALRTAKAVGHSAVKLIHGYGSSGRGGAIKGDVAHQLAAKKEAGLIFDFIPGEAFSPFEEAARRALAACPELARDSDYSRCNHGITIVML